MTQESAVQGIVKPYDVSALPNIDRCTKTFNAAAKTTTYRFNPAHPDAKTYTHVIYDKDGGQVWYIRGGGTDTRLPTLKIGFSL